MGACCPCCVVTPPPDAVARRCGSKEPGRCQRRVGFGESLPIGPPPIADGIATSGCDMGAGDNLARGTAGHAQRQPATKVCKRVENRQVVVPGSSNFGTLMKPAPPALQGSLLAAASTLRLLRLPVHVHRACGEGSVCADECSCMSKLQWKPVPASAWDGLCANEC